MTREEAINRIEEHARHCVPCVSIGEFIAFEMAIDALRAQQTREKLDRSRWEGCKYCNDPSIGIWIGHLYKYCPYCVAPQNEEAWVELERRINDGTVE